MLWLKAFHFIFVVVWFSGLFYLPRLFVYHAMTEDEISLARFKIMERKLFWGIMTPGAVLASTLGIIMLINNAHFYLAAGWMHIKLAGVLILWIYHFFCWKYLRDFAQNNNRHSHRFYRFFNEFPVLVLLTIAIMVIVKPL